MSAIRLRSIPSGPAIQLRSVSPGLRIRTADVGSLKLRVASTLPGPANVLSIGTVTDGVSASASITGNSPAQVLNLILPKGDKGDTGDQGEQGIQGPKGDTGNTGATGPANSLSIGTVEGGDTAAATITGTAPNQTLNLTLPKGDEGEPGDAATIAIGTVTTVDPTDPATVTNVGTPSAAVFNFEIPKGADGAGSVDSVNGQTGTVVLDADDIDDSATTNKFTTASDISKLAGIEASADVTDATNVAAAGAFMKSADDADDITEGASHLFLTTSERSAISGLASTYQPLDSDLTAIAALSPTNDDIVQRKAGAWTNRSMAQLATDLGLASAYQPLDSDLTTIAGLTATTNNFIQAKSSAWASRTPTQVTADLIAVVGDSGSGGTKGLVPAPSAGDAAAGKFLKADGTWSAPSGGGTAATQSDQETATSTTTFVSPGRQQFHPSAAKAWCKWQNTSSIVAGYNISSITDNGIGDWTLNFSASFSSANYAMTGSSETKATTAGVDNAIQPYVRLGGMAAGSLRIFAARGTDGDYKDPTSTFISCFGDQ